MKYLLLLGVIALAGCQPTPTPQTSISTAVVSPDSSSMMTLLTAARAEQGRGPVSEDARLSQAARAHAQDMIDNDYFSHDSQDGRSFSDRARAAGYACVAAENIAFGQPTMTDVVDTWLKSSGHRRNILLADAAEFGIGRVGDMWVLMMGRGC